jgi:hypothetical protein
VTTAGGKRTVSFSVQLNSAASLVITFVGEHAKTLLEFSAKAPKGRTRFTTLLPSRRLGKQSHLTLKVVSTSYAKRHAASVLLKI